MNSNLMFRKGIIVERVIGGETLRAKIYPISDKKNIYNFSYPDEKSYSVITYKKWKSIGNLRVKDVTLNKEVPFNIDTTSGSIDFQIEPNHNYSLIEK